MAANAPPQTCPTASIFPVAPSSGDGPVLNVINKRLRALRKKHNRIIRMEDSVAQGRVLNKKKEETLRSKAVVLAEIEELEKLKQPLAAAVAEEQAVAVKKYLESEKEKKARVLAEEDYVLVEDVKDGKEERDDESVIGVARDVLSLVYLGSIFDVKIQSEFASTMLARTHERVRCLTYDYVTGDDDIEVLEEQDMDFISQLGSFLTVRPLDSSLSHKAALERCVEHAKLWLAKSEQPIGPDTSITYAELRERLYKIMSSGYFTTTPEMKAPVDVAAAAAGNYGSYGVPVQESNVTGYGEDNFAQYEQQDVLGHYHGREIGDNDYSHMEDRRVHQNQRAGRGGGRRRYSKRRGFRGGSRGGGGTYQNDSNQYYDQAENYKTRNNNASSGRGPGSNQYGANTDAGHHTDTADTGVAR